MPEVIKPFSSLSPHRDKELDTQKGHDSSPRNLENLAKLDNLEEIGEEDEVACNSESSKYKLELGMSKKKMEKSD